MTPSIALPSLYRTVIAWFDSGKTADIVLNELIHKGVPEKYARPLMAAALLESHTEDV